MQPRPIRNVTVMAQGYEAEQYKKSEHMFTSEIRVADAEGVSYQWQEGYRNYSNGQMVWKDMTDANTSGSSVTGAKTATVTATVPASACHEDRFVRCVVKNQYGTTTSDPARIYANHNYVDADSFLKPVKEKAGFHALFCASKGCPSYKADTVVAHSYGEVKDVVKPATTTAEGSGYAYCKCGAKALKTIPKVCTSHTYPTVPTGAAALTAGKVSAASGKYVFTPGRVTVSVSPSIAGRPSGLKTITKTIDGHGLACTKCGYIKPGSGAEHTWGKWSVTTPATETVEGVESRTCSGCGKTETKNLGLAPHTHDFQKDAMASSWKKKDYERNHSWDATYHWKVCQDKVGKGKCGAIYDKWMHEFDDPHVKKVELSHKDSSGKLQSDGYMLLYYRECKECPYVQWLNSTKMGPNEYLMSMETGTFSVNGQGTYNWKVVKPGDKITVTAVPTEPFGGWRNDADLMTKYNEKGERVRARDLSKPSKTDISFFGDITDAANEQKRSFTFTMPEWNVYLNPMFGPVCKDYSCPTKIHIEGSEVPATCTSNGYVGVKYCPVCGHNDKYDKTTNYKAVIPALGHDFQVDPATVKLPSCTATGYTGDVKCTHCGLLKEKGQTLPKLDHDYTEKKTLRSASLSADGAEGMVCTKCGVEKISGKNPRITTVGNLIIGTPKAGQALTLNAAAFIGDPVTKSLAEKRQIFGDWYYIPASGAGRARLAENSQVLSLSDDMAGGTVYVEAYATDKDHKDLKWTSPKVTVSAATAAAVPELKADAPVVVTPTPKPSTTPKPGATPKPSATPKPGTTAAPTATPAASPAAKPTTTPAPGTTTPPAASAGTPMGTDKLWEAPAIQSTGVNPVAAGTAHASTQPVLIGVNPVELQAYALEDPETGNLTNYVKIRDVAFALNGTAAQFDVTWDGAVNLVVPSPYDHVNGQENHTPYVGDRGYTKADAATKVNGKVVDIGAFLLMDDNGGGSTYYKLRDVGQALGFNVGWSAAKGIFLEPGVAYSFGD